MTEKFVMTHEDLGVLLRGEDLEFETGRVKKMSLELVNRPTNGEMLMVVYPEAERISSPIKGKVCVKIGYNVLYFDPEWWNAPYGRKEENES